MVAKGERFLVCPDCGKRGVRFVLRPRGEDGFDCRYCDFECFCFGADEADVSQYDFDAGHRLEEANGGTL